MDAHRQDDFQNEPPNRLDDLGDRVSGAQVADPVDGGVDQQAWADEYAPVRRPTIYNLPVIQ